MKFSIRDVLWLTVVVALAVGWGIDHAQFRRELVKARDAEQRTRVESQLAMAAEQVARADAEQLVELARAMEAQLRTMAPPPDPQADPPSPTSAP